MYCKKVSSLQDIVTIRTIYIQYSYYHDNTITNTSTNFVHLITEQERKEIVDNAFKSYQKIKVKQRLENTSLMTDILNLCSIYQYPQKALTIWSDIKKINKNAANNNNIPFGLILKCLIQSNNTNQAVQLIKDYGSNIAEPEMDNQTIQHLITQCINKSQLNIIRDFILHQNPI